MPISYQEPAQLTCPACGADFAASVWLILDAGEQPAAVDLLLQGELNQVHCPDCGNIGPAGAPLLYHDAAGRQVIFAPTPGAAEHELRDQARDLHAVLVGSIPEEQRRPYLADVDIAQDLDGIALKLRRKARRSGAASAAPAPPVPTPPPTAGESEQPPPLLVAVEAFLSANSPEELEQVLAAYPILRDRSTDAMLAALAEVARDQRSPDIAESLLRARQLLAGMNLAAPPPTPLAAPSDLPLEAVQALLNAVSVVEVAAVASTYPQLLHPQADMLLAARVEAALDDGHDRLAQALEDRREALAAIRLEAPAVLAAVAEPGAEATIDEAIEALLIADGEDAMVEVIDRYPILLEDVAAEALWQFAAEARASGDEALAGYVIECRELLRRVRAGLDQ
ncbi:MAG: hypothetical protein HC822_24725 [Oscillochloris sp.]|nr:hypothetical protein [Oscillochloris sp.]